MNQRGNNVANGNGEIKPLFRSVKTDEQKKGEFNAWASLKPVYFPTWVWQEVCQRYPLRYKMFLPVYQGQKVVLT